MGLGTWISDEVFGEAQRRRKEQADTMAQSLMAKGDLAPEAINSIVNDWVQTGKSNIPTYQTKELPGTNLFPEGIPTRQPVNFGKKKGLFTLDQGSGQISQVDTPEGMTDFDVKTIPPQKPTNGNVGHTWKMDTATGSREDLGANGKTYDTYVSWDSKKGTGGGGAKDPQTIFDLDNLKKYQGALLKGEDIPDSVMDSVRASAQRQNIDMAEVQKDPGMLDTLFNSLSEATGGKTPAAKPKFAEPSLRTTPKAGKPLTKDLAQKFMQQAGGNKDKARKLAKAAGYTF